MMNYKRQGLTPSTLSVERYVYNGWNVVEVLDGKASNTVVRKQTWGQNLGGGIGGLLAVVNTASSSPGWLYFYDGFGNVGQVVDRADNSIVARYEYDAYGNTTVSAGSASLDNPYRFSTKAVDNETGLLYYGYRYYSPKLGRWISRDPLQEQGGLNLYEYCNGNPVDGMDQLGLVNWGVVGRGTVGFIANGVMAAAGYALAAPTFGAAGVVACYGTYQAAANFGNIINGLMDNGEGPTGPAQMLTQAGMLTAGVTPDTQTWNRGNITGEVVDAVIPTVLAGQIDTRLLTRPLGDAGTLAGAIEQVYVPLEEANSLLNAAVKADQAATAFDVGKFLWDESKAKSNCK